MNTNLYPSKDEELAVQVKFLSEDNRIIEDFAWMQFNESNNCYVFHTMAFGWLKESDVISWKILQ